MATETIYLAGGCFWGVQKFFDQFDGVMSTETGYSNGETPETTYDDIRSTGHAEAVKIEYDPQIIPLSKLLTYYFMVIDPTSLNRQGMDFGRQYRTGIYYTDDSQLPAIRESIETEKAKYSDPIVVEVLPVENYCAAEFYHQKYLDKVPRGYCHIHPQMFTIQAQEKAETID